MVSLMPLRPDIVWSAKVANRAAGREGLAVAAIGVADPGGTHPVWDPVMHRFLQPDDELKHRIGPCGHFLNSNRSYWNNNDQATKGLTLASLGSTGWVETFALPSDYIVSCTGIANGMRIHTDDTVQGLVEGPEDRSTSYDRVWQVLIRRSDGADLEADAVFPYVSSSQLDLAGRIDNGQRFLRKVPGRSDGWYWMWTVVPPDAVVTAVFWGVAVPAGQAHTYEIESPQNYSVTAATSNIPRLPVINSSSGSGHHGEAEVHLGFMDPVSIEPPVYPCPRSGYVALAFSLPYGRDDYLDYDGTAGTWPDGTLLHWTAGIGDNGVRVAISSVYGIAAWIEKDAAYPVYLDQVGEWKAFEPIGLVMRWEQLDGNVVAELYVNGHKYDDIYLSSSLPIDEATTGSLTIGQNRAGVHRADAWIEQVAVARHRITQDEARELSLLMNQLCAVREAGLL